MPAPRNVLILGGTGEAVEIAQRLVARGRMKVTTALAGRTRDPVLPPGKVRIGGFGGADGLAAYLIEAGIDLLIDATHPFATQISAHALCAARQTGILRLAFVRPAWQARPGDNWRIVADSAAAARAVKSGTRVFLALGRQHIEAFAPRRDVHFFARMIEPPARRFENWRFITGRPGAAATEAKLFEHHRIDTLVCRNAGGDGAYGKINAARALRLPVIMIDRPPPTPAFSTLDDLFAAMD